MTGAMAVDTSTMLVLAAIGLAEGLERVPAGAVVLRRVLAGAWQIEPLQNPAPRIRLVHWWSPWTEAIVVPPSAAGRPPLNRADLARRLTATAAARGVARIIGAATLSLLIVGVPAAFGLAGAAGGLFALAGVLTGQTALAVLSWWGLKRLGAGRPDRLRALSVHLNPFAAPGLAARLLAAAVTGAPPAAVAQALLPPERWAEWFRPHAYDARVARAGNRDLGEELEGVEWAIDAVLAQRPVMPEDGLWCPRCAATYRSGTTACADCNVPLLAASQFLPPVARLGPEPRPR